MTRPRTFESTGDAMTFDDLQVLVSEMMALGVPGEAVIHARTKAEINLRFGARVTALVLVPPDQEAGS